VARDNRLRIIEGGELKHVLAEYLALDVASTSADSPGGHHSSISWDRSGTIVLSNDGERLVT